MFFQYNPETATAYARTYALYSRLPQESRLFYYSTGNDCANFISQCVWAGYGGWLEGTDPKTVEENRARITSHVRMAPFIWYGSADFSGSVRWCRVVEFYSYVVSSKDFGPRASLIAEGDWKSISPRAIREGDVLQLVVQSYIPGRYGHSLYVTKGGRTWDDILICCHSYDRLDEPLSSFAMFPDQYPRMRVIRFSGAQFYK
jgi:hypothetical protein